MRKPETPAQSGGVTVPPRWPYCADIDGRCIAFDAGQALGEHTLTALLGFLLTAKEGARLSLQRNHDGFTLQVTGEVQRKSGPAVDLAAARALRRKMDLL